LLIYKSLIKSMWTYIYGLQLWGNTKKSNLNKIHTVQNKILHSNTNVPLPYIFNFILYFDLKMKTIHEEAKTYYKRFFNKMPFHPNPLIYGLTTHTIPEKVKTHHGIWIETGAEIFLIINEKNNNNNKK